MEPSSEILKQIAYSTRSKTEKHLLITMDQSTDEKHLSHPLQTNIRQL